jgi:alpha-beta hydrolase superfamily lysophospholipase
MAEQKFWTSRDGTRIHALHWPTPSPRAVLGFLHGLGEHIGRYEEFARRLNGAGYAVMGHDHPGFGRSEGKRGHIPSYSALLDNVEQLVKTIKETYPQAPVVLYGHSMGGNVLLNYLLSTREKVQAAIGSAPWIDLAFKPSALKVQLGRAIRSLLPALSMKNELDTSHLSRDPKAIQEYEDDPLVHDRITPNTGVFLMDKAEVLSGLRGKIDIPLLLMHGSADQITSFPASEAFVDRVGGDLTFKAWEGSYHELHHDTNKQDVMDYVVEWLHERFKNA